MAAALPPLDERLVAMMIHDLRNPLNGICMSWSYLDGELAADPRDDVRESHRIVGDSAQQLHAMLMLLTDYVQLSQSPTFSEPTAIDPRAFLTAIVEERRRRRVGRPRNAITLNFAKDGPATIPFSAQPARIAARLALDNTLTAAGSAKVRVESRWDDQRWRTAFVIDEGVPAPSGPSARHPLRFDQSFEHLLGAAKQRQGLDLALVGWISDRLKGAAYLKEAPGRPAAIVLDWPVLATA